MSHISVQLAHEQHDENAPVALSALWTVLLVASATRAAVSAAVRITVLTGPLNSHNV